MNLKNYVYKFYTFARFVMKHNKYDGKLKKY